MLPRIKLWFRRRGLPPDAKLYYALSRLGDPDQFVDDDGNLDLPKFIHGIVDRLEKLEKGIVKDG